MYKKSTSKWRRIISLSLVIALAASLMIGCGKKQTTNQEEKPNTTETTQKEEKKEEAKEEAPDYGDTGGLILPLTDKPVTLTMLVPTAVLDLEKKFAFQELEKRTGLTLDVQEVPESAYAEKFKVILASGKLPDIMLTGAYKEINKIAEDSNALVAINEHVDILPNFKKVFVDNPEASWALKSYSAPNGNMYMWPKYNSERVVNHGYLFRKDIFDKHGIKEWTTTEEFYDALKKLKEIYPDSTPFVSKLKESLFNRMSYGWGIKVPAAGGRDVAYYNEDEKVWKSSVTAPEFKEMLDFIKKLYNEGLLDPEFLTDTQESWSGKMAQDGKGFVTFDWVGRMDMFREQVKDTNPDYDLRYALPIGPVGQWLTLSKVSGYGVAIADNKNKELSLKLVDYLTSPSGAELMTMGVEGITFVRESDGSITYPEFADKETISIKDLEEKYGMFTDGTYLRMADDCVYFNLSEREQEAADKMVKHNRLAPNDPILKFTAEEEDKLSELVPPISTAALEFATKYVIEPSYGEAQWNEWIKQAENLKIQEAVDIHNQAQKRFDQ